MNCDDVRDRLNAYVDGELPAEAVQRVEKHLKNCDECSKQFEEYEGIGELLQKKRVPEPPETLKSGVMEAVAETDESGQAVVGIETTGNHTVVVEKGSLSTDEHTVVGVEEGGEPSTSDTDEPAGTTTEEGQPGFGPVVALLALVAVAGLGWRRARR